MTRSKVVELAEAEAEQVESEPEPEPEAEPDEEKAASKEDAETLPEGLSPEQAAKKLGQAIDRFGKTLQRIFELDTPPTQTEVPGVIGFVLPGFGEWRAHENYKQCPVCNGHGEVLTGSLKEGEKTQPCPDPRCKGRGFWAKNLEPLPPAVQPTGPLAIVTGPTAQPNGEWPEAPAWLGDPNLGAGR